MPGSNEHRHSLVCFPCYAASSFRVLTTCRKDWMGEMDKKASFELLDYFYEQGGNFIDT